MPRGRRIAKRVALEVVRGGEERARLQVLPAACSLRGLMIVCGAYRTRTAPSGGGWSTADARRSCASACGGACVDCRCRRVPCGCGRVPRFQPKNRRPRARLYCGNGRARARPVAGGTDHRAALRPRGTAHPTRDRAPGPPTVTHTYRIDMPRCRIATRGTLSTPLHGPHSRLRGHDSSQ